ncbi:MAG: EpsI family protein, partial [Betaproteobacteria bacterium]|nr:EpsI family protein [Betaproteobacteria bacterium]
YNPVEGAGASVNLFVAYYANQTDGRAVHSPQICLPGDGWETANFRTTQVQPDSGAVMPVNRAVIQKGLSRALVYYWFDGRGRRVTNEYLAKWYILWDGITRRRTDGALVRVVTPLAGVGDEVAADERLRSFLGSIDPKLPVHIPR